MTMAEENTKQTVALNSDVVFQWSGKHDLWLFPDKAAFDACDFSKATQLADNTQTDPYTYKASKVGTFYFGCNVGGGDMGMNHCKSPQKLALTVGMFRMH